MPEWILDAIAYLMDELGLSEDEARERSSEDYFESDEL